MNKMLLKDFDENISAVALAKLKKLVVRELDETDRGNFVAYIDDGEETFDVNININVGKIATTSCDCKNGSNLCNHKLAVLLVLKHKKITTTKIKVGKKKITVVETLLNDLDLASLKEWLTETLSKNKDLELLFINNFSVKSTTFTSQEVTAEMEKTAKAIVKTKRLPDPTELKKIVELWTSINKPVIDFFVLNLGNEVAFNCIIAIVDTCYTFHNGRGINSNKITKYSEIILQQLVEPINDLQVETTWLLVINQLVNSVNVNYKFLRLQTLVLIESLASISSEERKEKIFQLLIQDFAKIVKSSAYDYANYAKKVLNIITENGYFKQYYSSFQTLHYENVFNHSLIKNLIEINQLRIAEAFCKKEIAGNYKTDYNLPYMQFLKEIYIKLEDKILLIDIAKTLLPFNFNYEDYVYVYENWNDSEEEKKVWRSKFLSKVKSGSHSNKIAAAFYFKVLAFENNYKKLADSIGSSTPISLVVEHFDKLFLVAKDVLLMSIINSLGDRYYYDYEDVEARDKEYIELAMLVKKHYDSYTINQLIKKEQASFYRTTRLVSFLIEAMKQTN